MYPFYPKLGSGPDDAESLQSVDDEAISRFTKAYGRYVKVLGTNTVRPVAIAHPLGASESVTIHTLHIRLAGAEQSLLVVPIFREESLAQIDLWLDAEFEEELELEEWYQTSCYLIADGNRLRIEENIEVLTGLDDDLETTTQLTVCSSRYIDKALAAYERLDTDEYLDLESEVKGKIMTYAFFGNEECEECGEPIVFAAEILKMEEVESGKVDRTMTRHQFHEEEYHAFCLLLSWLCERGEVGEFVSLNHIHGTEEAMTEAVASVHKDDLEKIDSMVAGVANLLGDFVANQGAEEDSQDGKRTLH